MYAKESHPNWIRAILVATVGLLILSQLAQPTFAMDLQGDGMALRVGDDEDPPPSTPEIPDYNPPTASSNRPPLYEVPRSMRPEDHFYLTRPIQSGSRNWPHPAYRFGTTLFGTAPIHAGVDMAEDPGTPIVAAGSGHVIWAGIGFYRGVYDPEDPYGNAVAIHHDFGYGGSSLFTVYGHMSSIAVWPGQWVEAGQVIGTVGSTGRSSGPHLHFEVRLGEKIYSTVYNPELWMSMPEGWGVLAGRLEDEWGRNMHEQRLRIISLDTGLRWDVWTYASDTMGVDPFYRENFAISDLPAGRYHIETEYRWRIYSARIDLLPGQTTFIIFRGRSGFLIEPELEGDSWSAPIP